MLGCGGFIGSHLLDHLLTNNSVRIEGWDPEFSKIIGHLSNPRFKLHKTSISDPGTKEQLEQAITQADVVVNLAAICNPAEYNKRPLQVIHSNLFDVYHVIKMCAAHRKWLVHFSTSEVYGDPLEHPQTESYWGNVNPIGLRSCYDEGKRVAETLMMDYHRQNGVDTRIARIFNTYGPRMLENDGRVVSNFIVQALQGKPLTIYGDGKQTRAFCFVEDLVDGLVRLMNADGLYDPVNLGNQGEFTIEELAIEVARLCGANTNIRHEPLPADDPRQRKPDTTRAHDLLGWEPKVILREGLERTIADFRARL